MPATYTAIASQTVSGAGVSTISFTSIPATYTDLHCVFLGTGNAATSVIFVRLNNVSANYSYAGIKGNGATQVTPSTSSTNALYLSDFVDFETSRFNLVRLDIMDYSSATYNATMLIEAAGLVTAGSLGKVSRGVANYSDSSAAINRVDFIASGTTFATNTTVTLYGILKA